MDRSRSQVGDVLDEESESRDNWVLLKPLAVKTYRLHEGNLNTGGHRIWGGLFFFFFFFFFFLKAKKLRVGLWGIVVFCFGIG